MSDPYYLTAFIDERGQRRPFSLKIEGPFSTSKNGDYYCKIQWPEILGKEFNVYGEDGNQTKQLALKFIEICLQGKKIYDSEGNPLGLDPWE